MKEIDFLKRKKIAFISSSIFIIASFLFLFLKGANLGIDFVGGRLLHLHLSSPLSVDALSKLRKELKKEGIECSIQRLGEEGNEALIRTSTDISFDEIKKVFKEFGPFSLLREEEIGPSLSKELFFFAIIALSLAIGGMMLYITVRFKAIFALAAIVALLHDVCVTMGAVLFAGIQINIPIVAAFLTIIGYSLNDTIVVFDRVRENMKMEKAPFSTLINKSINQTLGRTLITSLTTLIVLVFLYVFGVDVMRDFAFALIVGVCTGTYSTIFIASPLVELWSKKKRI